MDQDVAARFGAGLSPSELQEAIERAQHLLSEAYGQILTRVAEEREARPSAAPEPAGAARAAAPADVASPGILRSFLDAPKGSDLGTESGAEDGRGPEVTRVTRPHPHRAGRVGYEFDHDSIRLPGGRTLPARGWQAYDRDFVHLAAGAYFHTDIEWIEPIADPEEIHTQLARNTGAAEYYTLSAHGDTLRFTSVGSRPETAADTHEERSSTPAGTQHKGLPEKFLIEAHTIMWHRNVERVPLPGGTAQADPDVLRSVRDEIALALYESSRSKAEALATRARIVHNIAAPRITGLGGAPRPVMHDTSTMGVRQPTPPPPRSYRAYEKYGVQLNTDVSLDELLALQSDPGLSWSQRQAVTHVYERARIHGRERLGRLGFYGNSEYHNLDTYTDEQEGLVFRYDPTDPLFGAKLEAVTNGVQRVRRAGFKYNQTIVFIFPTHNETIEISRTEGSLSVTTVGLGENCGKFSSDPFAHITLTNSAIGLQQDPELVSKAIENRPREGTVPHRVSDLSRNPQEVTVIHELGHFYDPVHDYSVRRRKLTEAEQAQAATISGYGASNRAEFIAEAFTHIVLGGHVTADARELYTRLHGPVPVADALPGEAPSTSELLPELQELVREYVPDVTAAEIQSGHEPFSAYQRLLLLESQAEMVGERIAVNRMFKNARRPLAQEEEFTQARPHVRRQINQSAPVPEDILLFIMAWRTMNQWMRDARHPELSPQDFASHFYDPRTRQKPVPEHLPHIYDVILVRNPLITRTRKLLPEAEPDEIERAYDALKPRSKDVKVLAQSIAEDLLKSHTIDKLKDAGLDRAFKSAEMAEAIRHAIKEKGAEFPESRNVFQLLRTWQITNRLLADQGHRATSVKEYSAALYDPSAFGRAAQVVELIHENRRRRPSRPLPPAPVPRPAPTPLPTPPPAPLPAQPPTALPARPRPSRPSTEQDPGPLSEQEFITAWALSNNWPLGVAQDLYAQASGLVQSAVGHRPVPGSRAAGDEYRRRLHQLVSEVALARADLQPEGTREGKRAETAAPGEKDTARRTAHDNLLTGRLRAVVHALADPLGVPGTVDAAIEAAQEVLPGLSPDDLTFLYDHGVRTHTGTVTHSAPPPDRTQDVREPEKSGALAGLAGARRTLAALDEETRGALLSEAAQIMANHHQVLPLVRGGLTPGAPQERRSALSEDVATLIAERLHRDPRPDLPPSQRPAWLLSERLSKELGTRATTDGATGVRSSVPQQASGTSRSGPAPTASSAPPLVDYGKIGGEFETSWLLSSDRSLWHGDKLAGNDVLTLTAERLSEESPAFLEIVGEPIGVDAESGGVPEEKFWTSLEYVMRTLQSGKAVNELFVARNGFTPMKYADSTLSLPPGTVEDLFVQWTVGMHASELLDFIMEDVKPLTSLGNGVHHRDAEVGAAFAKAVAARFYSDVHSVPVPHAMLAWEVLDDAEYRALAGTLLLIFMQAITAVHTADDKAPGKKARPTFKSYTFVASRRHPGKLAEALTPRARAFLEANSEAILQEFARYARRNVTDTSGTYVADPLDANFEFFGARVRDYLNSFLKRNPDRVVYQNVMRIATVMNELDGQKVLIELRGLPLANDISEARATYESVKRRAHARHEAAAHRAHLSAGHQHQRQTAQATLGEGDVAGALDRLLQITDELNTPRHRSLGYRPLAPESVQPLVRQVFRQGNHARLFSTGEVTRHTERERALAVSGLRNLDGTLTDFADRLHRSESDRHVWETIGAQWSRAMGAAATLRTELFGEEADWPPREALRGWRELSTLPGKQLRSLKFRRIDAAVEKVLSRPDTDALRSLLHQAALWRADKTESGRRPAVDRLTRQVLHMLGRPEHVTATAGPAPVQQETPWATVRSVGTGSTAEGNRYPSPSAEAMEAWQERITYAREHLREVGDDSSFRRQAEPIVAAYHLAPPPADDLSSEARAYQRLHDQITDVVASLLSRDRNRTDPAARAASVAQEMAVDFRSTPVVRATAVPERQQHPDTSWATLEAGSAQAELLQHRGRLARSRRRQNQAIDDPPRTDDPAHTTHGLGEPVPGTDSALRTGHGRGFGASVDLARADENSPSVQAARGLIDIPEEVERPAAARAEAARLLALLLHDPDLTRRLVRSGARVIVLPRHLSLTELMRTPVFPRTGNRPASDAETAPRADARGWTFPAQRRAVVSEENLLGQSTGDHGRAHPENYSSVLHEVAHLVHVFALTAAQRARVIAAYEQYRAAGTTRPWIDGPVADPGGHITGNLASSGAEEYFAQSVVAYFGANHGRDHHSGQARNNGAAWIERYDPTLYGFLHELLGPPPAGPLHANALSVTDRDDELWTALAGHTARVDAALDAPDRTVEEPQDVPETTAPPPYRDADTPYETTAPPAYTRPGTPVGAAPPPSYVEAGQPWRPKPEMALPVDVVLHPRTFEIVEVTQLKPEDWSSVVPSADSASASALKDVIAGAVRRAAAAVRADVASVTGVTMTNVDLLVSLPDDEHLSFWAAVAQGMANELRHRIKVVLPGKSKNLLEICPQ